MKVISRYKNHYRFVVVFIEKMILFNAHRRRLFLQRYNLVNSKCELFRVQYDCEYYIYIRMPSYKYNHCVQIIVKNNKKNFNFKKV